MRRKVSQGLGFMTILFSGWLTVAWSGSEMHLSDSSSSNGTKNVAQPRAFTSEKNCTIPRDQVLLEIVTGTW